MPVWKYRRIEDMPESSEMNADVPLGRRIRSMMRIGNYAGALGMPRGVRKYRSFEEMHADRDRYEQERIDRLRERNARINDRSDKR